MEVCMWVLAGSVCPYLHGILDEEQILSDSATEIWTMQWYQSPRPTWNLFIVIFRTCYRNREQYIHSRRWGIFWQVLTVWSHSINRSSEQCIRNNLWGILENVLSECSSLWFTMGPESLKSKHKLLRNLLRAGFLPRHTCFTLPHHC